jgi:predicted HNH restriction endonuclease
MRQAYCEICEQYGFVDRHHIHAKSMGGCNQQFNIINVCPNCHRKIHAGEINIICKAMTTLGWKVITGNYADHQFIYR